jgi:3-oxoacyl-[acyl-carrier protein] reductase
MKELAFDFAGKIVVVTGASRGMGRCIAEDFLKRGAEVYVTSTQTDLEWTHTYPHCHHVQTNFLNQDHIYRLLEKLTERESVDILVNNAGIYIPGGIDEQDLQHWKEVMTVNLYAPMHLMRGISPLMKRAGKGKILNIASIAAIVSRPLSTAYSASKTGLIGLTRASALRLAPFGILVNALCPGYTQTDMMDKGSLTEEQKIELKESVPLKKFASVQDIANFTLFLCSDGNSYITGQTIVVDGGVTIQ